VQSSWFQAIIVDDAAQHDGSSSSSSSSSALPTSFGLHIVRGKDLLTKVIQRKLSQNPLALLNFYLRSRKLIWQP
jgi:hypothetical protein